MPRRHLDLQNMEQVRQEVRELRHQGYTWAGNWNLMQICTHITDPMNWAIDGFTFKVPLIACIMIKITGFKKSF